MSIPGYDAWKLMTPEEDYEANGGTLCPFCGAYSSKHCDLEEESGGICPWEESQPNPDDQRIENERMSRQFSDDGEVF